MVKLFEFELVLSLSVNKKFRAGDRVIRNSHNSCELRVQNAYTCNFFSMTETLYDTMKNNL